jgi:hypothetical protein
MRCDDLLTRFWLPVFWVSQSLRFSEKDEKGWVRECKVARHSGPASCKKEREWGREEELTEALPNLQLINNNNNNNNNNNFIYFYSTISLKQPNSALQ